jgi:methylated-DNA-[protein]-cysteine S-methyltransferase
MTVLIRSVPSPLGDLLLVGDGERLQGLYMTNHRPAPSLGQVVPVETGFDEAIRQLDEWFAGRRRQFDLALMPLAAASPFQREVWDVLRDIPFGGTMTYGEVATKVGRPGSARAVGHAVGRNPVSIIVPCHRVVGSGGGLTGYAGGIENKRWLLAHERAIVAAHERPPLFDDREVG